MPACPPFHPSLRLARALASRRLALGLAVACLLGSLPVHARAQQPLLVQPQPQNVLTLSAEASREVAQDLMSITLAVQREGGEAAAVQSQLRQALDAALAEARRAARPGALEVRTGSFNLSPRYAAPRPGQPSSVAGWQGRAELVLEGSDLAAISQLAGRLSTMTVARVGFGLSREAREKAEAEVSAQAIARFKARAETHAQQFGFASWSLREVAINSGIDGGPQPVMMRMSAAAAPPAMAEAQPVEPGRATVSVTVSGSIQLSPR